MEKEVRISHVIKPAYFVVFAIILELVNFLWLGFTVTGSPETTQVLPKYFFLDVGFILFVAGIIFMLPRKGANAVFYVIIGLQAFVGMINATLYKVFGDIFSFDMMKLGVEAVAAFKFQFIDFWNILVNLVILGIIITTQVLLDRKLTKVTTLKKINKRALLLICFFSSWLVAFTSFFSQTLTMKESSIEERVNQSDKYLWQNMQFKLEAYKKFGTWGFYLKSLSNLIYKPNEYNAEIEAELLKDLEEGQQEVDVTAPLYGDNLVFIMLESFEWFAIDPYNTPTLWEIRTQTGVSLENFYSKNKTNISEGIGILGNMPKDLNMGTLAANGNSDTKYTLPNLFKSQGYTANYFHSYKKTFYNRDQVNLGMGFDNVYGLEDADLENKSTSFNNWNLDSDYFTAMKDEFIPTDSKFMTFFTTVTTHGTYNRTNERFEEYYNIYDANLEVYKEWLSQETTYVYPTTEKLEKCFRQYKCAAMDTDRMVALLLQDLKDKTLLENTTIVLYADHNCYYEDIYFNIKGTSKADYNDIYNYNVPCMIYSTKLVAEQKTEFVNTYDLYPTICELFGLPYNKALTQGYNIYSTEIEDSVMASYLSGVFNSQFYSLNLVDVFAVDGATQEELDRFKKNGCKFFEKQKKIELIYKYGLAV